MNSLLPALILVPLSGFLLSLFIPRHNEKFISGIAFLTTGLELLLSILFITLWLLSAEDFINIKEIVIYKTAGYEFFIDLYFDRITAVYLITGSILSFLIAVYSRYYMHRESGYKRFFNTKLFFVTGYMLVILSGNFETMFIGWEILGVSSFLLIAYYRNRYLPVKNAVKVFSIYRIGDVGILLAMWMSHHLWHENITFEQFNNVHAISEHIKDHEWLVLFISFMLLLSASAKSAQFPFSSWLPRAMEGPTPSSAIFYGSLSVHIGVFLMMRSYPFWEQEMSVRIFIIVMGLVTSFVATQTARVQSSIKAQIAYASAAQIGLIFIEVALGLQTLALIHFAGNAFLRTYQLLVSPSVVTYLIKEQFYNYQAPAPRAEDTWPSKIRHSIYMMSLREWRLDDLMYQNLWNPIKKAGNTLNFLKINTVIYYFGALYLMAFALWFINFKFPGEISAYIPSVLAFIGLLMVLKAFTERYSPRLSLLLVMMNHAWIALAVSFNENFRIEETILYLAGVAVSGIIAYLSIARLRKLEGHVDLQSFKGHIYEHPKIGLLFLLACLGLSGFPITTTFLGEDLIFSHIHPEQIALACFAALSFILNGLALIRLYARIFLGPHIKTYHERAHRSS
jgi:NADH:ubiquinone oxidoreductase subunit 5 (subunit L)/multisubunit Na+/H+ antiporter MnhA subunit